MKNMEKKKMEQLIKEERKKQQIMAKAAEIIIKEDIKLLKELAKH